MKLLGMDVKTAKELDANQIIMSLGQEKLIISVDKAGMEPPQYILM